MKRKFIRYAYLIEKEGNLVGVYRNAVRTLKELKLMDIPKGRFNRTEATLLSTNKDLVIPLRNTKGEELMVYKFNCEKRT